MGMGSAVFDYSDRLEQALHRRHSSMSVGELLQILEEADESPAADLSAGEREFLLESSEVTAEDLTDEARSVAQSVIARDRSSAEEELRASALSTSEVAALLGRDAASIRRSKRNGDLYALAPRPGLPALFPAWQFSGDRVVPGLREVIPALPSFLHPLSVERFMTTPDDALDGLSPAVWLLSGGSPRPVAALADALGYV